MKYIYVLVFIALPLSGIYSQALTPGFSITGKIIDGQTKKTLEYVNIVLYLSSDSSIVTGTISEEDGSFRIDINRPGKFYISADFIGYQKSFKSGIILSRGLKKVDLGEIKLNPALVGIEEVEVIAEKPFITYHLDKKVVDVSKNPSAEGGTAVEALENVPSIQTDIEGNVTLRGSSSFTVLIDGRQSPLTGTDALRQIPASAIDRIEIITNPSVKYDPDGTTGIINIISKKGKLRGHSLVVNANAGSSPMYGGNVNYSYRKEKITFTGSANLRNVQRSGYRLSDQTIFYTNNRTGEIDSTRRLYNKSDRSGGISYYSFKGGVDYKLIKGNVMNIGLTYNNFTFSRESESKISNFYREPYQTNKVSKDGFSVNPENWQFNIGDKHVFNNNQQHYISIDATYQVRQGPQKNSIETSQANSSWIITRQDTVDQKTEIIENGKRLRIELDYMHPVGDKFIVEAGYTLRSDLEDQNFLLYNRDFDAEEWTEITGSDDFSHYYRIINAGWALFKGELKGLNISGGLRIEHTDRHVETEKDNYNFDYNYLGYYPSFSISMEFLKGNTLQASYSKRIERPRPWHLNPFPRLSDGYSIYIPNPELEPEYASAWELNYQKSLGGISFLSLETFYHHTKNKIERLDITDSDTLLVFTRTNLNSDKRFGAELGGQIKITNWFSLMPGLTAYYYEAEGDIKGESRSVNDVIFNGRLTTNFTLPTKTRLQLLGFYRGPEVEISEEEKAMYWFSAAVRQELMDRKLSVSFRVDDVFSTRIRKEKSYSENSFIYSEGSRKSPVFVLSLTLLLNQKPEKRNGMNGNGRNNGDEGGGMDMEF